MTTTQTTKLQLPRRWYDLPTPLACVISIFAVAGIIAAAGRIHAAPTVAAVPTPALSIIIATSAPVPTPAAVVAAVLPNGLRRAVVAYDAPVGTAIGAIEQGRVYQVLARWGSEWLQADVTGSGVVWLRSADVLDLPAGLADVQPPPAPSVVYVSAPAPAYAAPTPAQPVYAVTSDQQPADDFYTTPPHVDPAFQQALIGSDPNALACNGSPLCGGLTNAQAQAALDAQRAGR